MVLVEGTESRQNNPHTKYFQTSYFRSTLCPARHKKTGLSSTQTSFDLIKMWINPLARRLKKPRTAFLTFLPGIILKITP